MSFDHLKRERLPIDKINRFFSGGMTSDIEPKGSNKYQKMDWQFRNSQNPEVANIIYQAQFIHFNGYNFFYAEKLT